MLANEIICFDFIKFENTSYYIYGRTIKNKFDFYKTPIRSEYLNIFASDKKFKKRQIYFN